MIIDLTNGRGTITQGAMKKISTFWTPARAVAKQASITVPPFLSASIPECTAKGSVVPATRPFPFSQLMVWASQNSLGSFCPFYRTRPEARF